jgi:hypothetical protein
MLNLGAILARENRTVSTMSANVPECSLRASRTKIKCTNAPTITCTVPKMVGAFILKQSNGAIQKVHKESPLRFATPNQMELTRTNNAVSFILFAVNPRL